MEKLSKTSIFQSCLKNQLTTGISLWFFILALTFISLATITGNLLYLGFLWGFLLVGILLKPFTMITVGYKFFLKNHRKDLEDRIAAHDDTIELLQLHYEKLSELSEVIFELDLNNILPNLKQQRDSGDLVDNFHKEKNKRDDDMAELQRNIESLEQEKQEMKKELEWVSEKIN